MKSMTAPMLALYAVSTVTSYVAFSFFLSQQASGFLGSGGVIQQAVPTPDPSNRIVIAPDAPKTEECPLNGKYYTVAERESWDTRRPLAVMIENHLDARPQSGLIKADVVYEAVVEGGITRFMPMYYCEVQAKDTLVAPVRSARQAFIDWASEYNMPLYVHVGGSNGEDTDPRVRGLEHLADYGWTLRNDLNQFSIGAPTFIRNYDRIAGKDIATEHTMESSTERLWALGVKRGYTNTSPDTKVKGKIVEGKDWREAFTPWKFADDKAEKGSVNSISYEFWSGYPDQAVRWEYDPSTNEYKRFMGGQAHLDLETGKQISAKNVIVQVAKEEFSVDIHHHNFIKTSSSGKAYLFANGEAQEINWSKKNRESRTVFTDAKGKDVAFARGMVWISVVNDKSDKPSY
ncbi:MAG: hypothetical protein UX04_C0002G0238 [Microgenomates group bacterium GW2011_GWF2_45_18]|nr:MAG: hypothetical protein UW18_C0003G0324 [Microgenomates group bacterium GW2011_GWF1_44_10]KKU02095.1 MAG: hypothetical protein UX04_C0002G0238 [Microgenomates group bacterium GW2011_GWF2_45_18]OGJ41383.1 MAG: hypothetical protein A2378_02900 [Candidatus Pacebacteria bacterium RIFOXYB1_FULL_44_10]HAU98648.1 hypothetical protein [Candidatus Paceibacterota bacterium]HAX01926.1 hypothetical protein [Candidatus Paceibacterota bacterium]